MGIGSTQMENAQDDHLVRVQRYLTLKLIAWMSHKDTGKDHNQKLSHTTKKTTYPPQVQISSLDQ